MTPQRLELPNATLTRLGHQDVAVPAQLVGLEPETIGELGWAAPLWAENGNVRVGAATWLAQLPGQRIAFDPMLAADFALRPDRATELAQQEAVAGAFAAAGMPRESVDLLLLSHIDGVGMIAWRREDGGFEPFFPNATILLSDVELAAMRARCDAGDDDLEAKALRDLIGRGCVASFADGELIADAIRARVSGGHGPGHALFTFAEDDPASTVTLLGHLAVSPLHLATGPCEGLHVDPVDAWAQLEALAGRGHTLIGPLWPAPGFGRWRDGRLIVET